MNKNIQISEELFSTLCNYFLLNPDSAELFDLCKAGLQSKLDKVINRDLYSKMHDANLSDAEREAARQEYLNRIGISENFRWSKDSNPH